MKGNIKYLPAMLLFFSCTVSAQFNGSNYSLFINYNYTSSSKIYFQPKASDEFLRGIHSFLDNVPGLGVEIRMKAADNFFIGLGADYLRKKGKINNVSVAAGTLEAVEAEDGFEVVPVELTGYYIFPFSLKNYKFFMGGGIGYYLGSHIRTVGDITSNTISRTGNLGIHVLTGVEVILTDYLTLRGSAKFRDVEFSMKSGYDKLEGNYNGTPVQIINPSFDTKVVINGIMFNIGLAWQF